jgi:hypothetical protein
MYNISQNSIHVKRDKALYKPKHLLYIEILQSMTIWIIISR